jgi:hypothetical protein
VAGETLQEFGRRTPLGGLLAALDETIMPQTLSATNAGGAELIFDVANRRLLRVRPGRGADLADCAPDPRDPAGVEHLCAALRAFAEDAPLHLSRGRVPATRSPGGTGISVVDLAGLLDTGIAPSRGVEATALLDTLLDAHSGSIDGWIYRAVDETTGQGAPQACAILEDLFHGLDQAGGAAGNPSVSVVERAGHGLVLVRSGEVAMGFATDPDTADELAAEAQEALLGWA